MSSPSTTSMNSAKLGAIISGVIGFLLFIATPFMPVEQTQSSFTWPQNQNLESINAPLMSYAPDRLDVELPLAATKYLREGQDMVLGTLPPDSTEATERGMFLRTTEHGLDIILRGKVPFQIPEKTIARAPEDAVLSLHLTDEDATIAISGTSYRDSEDEDMRPQITGIYTELDDTPANAQALSNLGLKVHVDINSRFTSSPSIAKYLSMGLGVLSLIIALICLHRLDTLDRATPRPLLPKKWWRPRPLDGIVGAILLYWHVFGANTSDDGFLLTMARASREAGYMANYYRWYGVPESPFGAPYYDLLALMTHVSSASIWMRLPALISGLAIWFLLSRAALPRLGALVSQRRTANWTAAFVFLAFWLPFNNGTRPEPIIALGALTTWLCFERAIVSSRLLPAAIGVIIATISLGAGPTGLMAVAALLVSLPALVRIVYLRLPLLGADPKTATKAEIARATCAQVFPFLPAGTAILIAVFGDQTLATVLESIRVRAEKGPALSWYDEWARYQSLLQLSVDGSMTRRFAVFLLMVSLLLVIAAMVRNGKVPGASRGPSHRLVFIIFGTMFFMMFTPTKWTHHFGVYAGIAGAMAALAAVALATITVRSVRSRIFFIGGMLFLFAIALAGMNGWWYVSSYGVPWWDKSVQYHGIEAANVMLVITLIVLIIGAIYAFREDFNATRKESPSLEETAAEEAAAAGAAVHSHASDKNMQERSRNTAEGRRRAGIIARRGLSTGGKEKITTLTTSPLAVSAALIVVFSMLSLGKGFISQYPAYSIGLGNLRSLAGNSCELAADVLAETDSNDSFLTPISGSLADSIDDGDSVNFSAQNIPQSISAEYEKNTAPGALADSVGPGGSEEATGQATGVTGGTRAEVGINGSTARLPFGLDYKRVPVIGSWQDSAEQYAAHITTQWYQLPQERSAEQPLIVVSAAGRIYHHDINGVKQEGQKLRLEYAHRDAEGNITKRGSTEMLETGPKKAWRNLRLPLDKLPAEANVVRISAVDTDLTPEEWVAFTPPRIPTLKPITELIDPKTPGLLDWSVALQFPCQRTFDHYAGVAEIPQYRISPDYDGKSTLTAFQDHAGGGIMGTAEAVNSSYELPAYLNHDWQRDWGSMEIYQRRVNSQGKPPADAKIDYQVVKRMGWWSPGHMMIDDEKKK